MVTLANAILQQDLSTVAQLVRYESDLNQLDEYGFTPLIEAAIVENIEIAQLLLQLGANPNQQDMTGGTALHWAAENNNTNLCSLLLNADANPNAYNFAGQPVLVMPILRQQKELRQLLVKGGADLIFAQDFINTKLLGHMYELIGTANIVDPANQFVEVDFEGFYLEITLGIIAESLAQFQNHFAARQLRRYANLSQIIVRTIERGMRLFKYQQYRIDIKQHSHTIDNLLKEADPLLIPVGYEGHAITFIRFNHLWVKCDRREDSRVYDNVMIYHLGNPQVLTPSFIKSLMYEKQADDFINTQLDQLLGLTPITEIRVEAQISGNCSWANVEAAIPAIFFLLLMQMNADAQAIAYHKTLALNYFHRWREWNKDRALHACIKSFREGDTIRKASKAEILAAILFQRLNVAHADDRARADLILSTLMKSPYDYILKNYLRVFYYESYTEEGKHFAELMREYGFIN